MWLRYVKAADLSALHDELLAAGVAPLRVEGTDTDVAVEVDAVTNASVVSAVVAAHNAATAGAARDARVANEQTLRDRVEGALVSLNAAWTNWATLTAAQKDGALRLNVRVTVALSRLQLRRLEGTE